MLEQHLILCGEIGTAGAKKATVHKIKLGKYKHKGQIYLDIDSITEKMVQDLPDAMRDLLEIATYVYVGDQIVSRGGKKSFDYGKKWHRCLNFKMPVREYEIWSDPDIKGLLEEALSFVSGDTYTFDFVPQPKDAFPGFLNFRTAIKPRYEYNQVLLFSGGLDSFTGAIEEILGNKNCPVLVSHQSNYKLVSLQRKLHEYLLSLCESGPEPLHVPVMINKDRRLTRETSQRTRSFLYASLGTIVASIFGLNRVRFYENGVISCNLSFDGQTLQARSTRVTHPKFLSLLSQLVSAVLGRDFHFENLYFSMTRTEVCVRLKELHHEKQICETRSCAKSRYVRPWTHCGTCFQCIGRRFATLGSQCQEYDPQSLYDIDVLRDKLDNLHDRAMAAGFAGFATHIERMTIDDFVIKYSSEVHEIARYIPSVSREEAIRALFHLHRRHAQKVNGVMETAISENKASIRKGTLPETCLVSMVARKEHLDIDKLLKKRTKAGIKHAKGELDKKVSNLLDQDPYMDAQTIKNRIGNTTADSVKHTTAWKKKHRKR